jgi:hypothetical protein
MRAEGRRVKPQCVSASQCVTSASTHSQASVRQCVSAYRDAHAHAHSGGPQINQTSAPVRHRVTAVATDWPWPWPRPTQLQRPPPATQPTPSEGNTAYRAGLCIDCHSRRYSAGRPRCNECHHARLNITTATERTTHP